MAHLPSLRSLNHSLVLQRISPNDSTPYFVPLIPLDLFPPIFSFPDFPRQLSASDVAVGGWTSIGKVALPARGECLKAWKDGGRVILGFEGREDPFGDLPETRLVDSWGQAGLEVNENNGCNDQESDHATVIDFHAPGETSFAVTARAAPSRDMGPSPEVVGSPPPGAYVATPTRVAPPPMSHIMSEPCSVEFPFHVPPQTPKPTCTMTSPEYGTPTPSPLRVNRDNKKEGFGKQVMASIEVDESGLESKSDETELDVFSESLVGSEVDGQSFRGRSRGPRESRAGTKPPFLKAVDMPFIQDDQSMNLGDSSDCILSPPGLKGKAVEVTPVKDTKKTGLWNSMHSIQPRNSTTPKPTMGLSEFPQPPARQFSNFSPDPQFSSRQTLPLPLPFQSNNSTSSNLSLPPHHPESPTLPPSPPPPRRRRTRRGGRGRRKGPSSAAALHMAAHSQFPSQQPPGAGPSQRISLALPPRPAVPAFAETQGQRKRRAYCQGWCQTGFCQVGEACEHKHEIPETPAGLRSVGLVAMPAWALLLGSGGVVEREWRRDEGEKKRREEDVEGVMGGKEVVDREGARAPLLDL